MSELITDGPHRSWFARWGRFTYRRRRGVIGATLAVIVVSVVWGTTVFGALTGGGFDVAGSESDRAADLVERTFGHVDADVVVVYRSEPGGGTDIDSTVAEEDFRRAVADVVDRLPADVVPSVQTYWTTGSEAFVSADLRSTYLTATLAGADETERESSYVEIADEFLAEGLATYRGGVVPISADMNAQVKADITRAEMISVPVLLVLLVIVFGSLVSAGLPLLVGAVAILGSFSALHVVALLTDVSVFSVNLVIMLGLGLSIDYSLFIVSRFREELGTVGSDPEHVMGAVERTMATAGRTVAFSGLIVGVSLGALLMFPMTFLRSMAYGGIASVAIAMTAAITVLPAVLGVLGRRVDRLRVPFLRRRLGTTEADSGAWARVARAVMRRPVAVATFTVALLLALGSPFLHVALGGVDARSLPTGTESRVAAEQLDELFPGAATSPIEVVLRDVPPADAAAYAETLAGLPGVTATTVLAEDPDVRVLAVSYDGDSADDAARDLVGQVRAAAPSSGEVLVGGSSAALVDLVDTVGELLPWAALYLAVVMFVLLFLAFGSVVLPFKAMAMNLVSLGATFGVLVWGFQDGNLAGLLDFTTTGTLEATQPMLIFVLAFGLSMDYEVFLLSRIREEWDRTGDNALAVARGLQRSGRIITCAALLFFVVVAAFATSGIVFVQMIGVGLAVAVLVDATVVRALLVPATMRLLGSWNWYSPAPLARWWGRHGLREPATRVGAG